jgi:hypothetical protein
MKHGLTLDSTRPLPARTVYDRMRIMVMAKRMFLAGIAIAAWGQSAGKLELHRVRAEDVTYRGKSAIHVTPAAGSEEKQTLAVVTGSNFQDGTIEVEMAGAPASGAGEGARGFIGIAFRVASGAEKYELFYLRPTNGRAEDQLRRNHSTQYVSVPDWPWERTRAATPGLYESYTDLEPGVWTKMKIVANGTKARLFVNGAEQPCLIVNDLKLGTAGGAVGLWVGPGTDGYFTGLKIARP